MQPLPYLIGADVADAQDLIAQFGMLAADEAHARAAHSRSLGNYIHFCRWRQIERLIDLLGTTEPTGSLH